MSSPRILLVVPAFNESARLPGFVAELCGEVARAGGEVAEGLRVQVVDDGSRPEEAASMAATVESLRGNYAFVAPVLRLDENRGKGGAVYAGWDTAEPATSWLGFVDADGAVGAAETVHLARECLEASSEGGPPPAIFAVRDPEAAEVERTPVRKVLGRVFAGLVHALFGFPLRDTQCGLKAVPASAYQTVRGGLTEFRFAFDVDLAARLLDQGVEIRELAIRWHESPGSTVKAKSALLMLLSVLRLKMSE